MTRFPLALLPALLFSAPYSAFAQRQEQAQLPTVTVVGETDAQQTRRVLEAEQARTPGGVTLLDSDDLAQRTIANSADMLRYVPGVWAASSTGTDGAFISIRGSNLDSVDYAAAGSSCCRMACR